VLSGIKIAIIGGDERELILTAELVKMGATVAVAGFPRDMVGHGAFTVDSIMEACQDAEVVIMPLPGTNAEGVVRAVYAENPLVLTEEALAGLAEKALVLIGSARSFLKEWSANQGFTLIEVGEMDELAILNSIPSAEGALQMAMEETRITIHGSQTCIIGFGRVGITLARMLKAMGAEVTVVARNRGQLARAYEMGCRRAEYSELKQIMNYMDIVFNTVPSMVLTQDILKHARQETVVIDLASQPGGTDFEAANLFGIKAILAPGLPGKVAPASAGRILADVVPALIIEELCKINQDLFRR
jgi:dipicolinate synthase subunit A